MSRRIIFLDFEGTGPDPIYDRIVEACFHIMPDALDDVMSVEGETWAFRVNPGIPIPAEATAVHGISDADIADAPPFAAYAADVQRLIDGNVLCGYNIRRYDSLILDAELQRAGQPGLARDPDGRICQRELDLFSLWQKEEPRNLATAATRFGGVDLENAHSAEADTLVLPDVLSGMMGAFGLGGLTLNQLCERCIPDGAVDRDGKFTRRDDGVVLYNFGNKRGTPVADDPGLARWMLGKDFSAETKAVARRLLEEIESAWLEQASRLASQGILPFVMLIGLALGACGLEAGGAESRTAAADTTSLAMPSCSARRAGPCGY